jgi:hypothetical protein
MSVKVSLGPGVSTMTGEMTPSELLVSYLKILGGSARVGE